MLNNEERNLLVKTYKEMPDAAKLAKIYNISASSVYRLVRQMKDTGSVDLRTGSRGRKSSLTSEDIENIRRIVIEQPDITIHEIRGRIHKRLSRVWQCEMITMAAEESVVIS